MDAPKQDLPGLSLPKSTAHIRKGLATDAFARRAKALKDRWCGLLGERFDPSVRETQQALDQRWTIHPAVDGCVPDSGPPEIR